MEQITLTPRESAEMIGLLQIGRDALRAQGFTGNDAQAILDKLYPTVRPTFSHFTLQAH
jgi:hypothetical protein